MNIDGPIISHSDTRTLFMGGEVYKATENTGACCFADNAADLEPYKALGWTIARLEGDELAAFLKGYTADVYAALEKETGERSWADLTEAEQARYYDYWALLPGTLENAAYNSCTKEERQTAVNVLRAMLDYAAEHGATDGDIETEDIRGILGALEHSL